MRILTCLLGLASALNLNAQIAPEHQGDWLMVNGVLVISVDADGTMTLRNTGASGTLAIADDGSFTWTLPEETQGGEFTNGKLFLNNAQAGSPTWIERLEFRRGTGAEASELIEFALRQQNQALRSFEQIRRTSQEKAILNNLRQLSAAFDQHCLEHGVTTATFDDIVGPDKYVRRINTVDGEDYRQLEFSQGTLTWEITSDSGITVSYDR